MFTLEVARGFDAEIMDREQRGRPWRRAVQRILSANRPGLVFALTACAWLAAALVLLIPAVHGTRYAGPLSIGLLCVLGAVTLVAARTIFRLAGAQQASYVRTLEQLAMGDDLTGLANRRAFSLRLAQEMLRVRRYGRPLSLVMIDLDGFKAVNDTFGHITGDAALTAFGGLLRNEVRATDLAARLGGDEFALILVEADETAAAAVVNRITQAVAAGPLLTPSDAGPVRIAVSAGIARLTDPDATAFDLISAADRALYASKRAHAAAVEAHETTDDRR